MDKIKCAIIGPGNIGMNLLYKISRSDFLECSLIVGHNKQSRNLQEAKRMEYHVEYDSLDSLIKYKDEYEIVFDSTNAESHVEMSAVCRKMNKFIVDLTPAKTGRLCVPCLNGKECLNLQEVNMITCGGQSVVPLAVALVNTNKNITYLESVSTISSVSAGAGTRANIDDYIHTTSQALREFTGIQKTKAMIVLNPADPPIIMRNTLYAITETPNIEASIMIVNNMAEVIEKYVPGYKMLVAPTLLKPNIIAVTVQVEGSGDFLPRYAGNLDVITCAGVEMAEQYARKKFVI